MGKRRPADVQVLTDEAGVVEHYAVMARDNHNFANFNKVGFDQAGNPSSADLHLAWTSLPADPALNQEPLSGHNCDLAGSAGMRGHLHG